MPASPRYARRPGVELVAEGLEDGDTAIALRNSDCLLGQGFHYSAAADADSMGMLVVGQRCLPARRA